MLCARGQTSIAICSSVLEIQNVKKQQYHSAVAIVLLGVLLRFVRQSRVLLLFCAQTLVAHVTAFIFVCTQNTWRAFDVDC